MSWVVVVANTEGSPESSLEVATILGPYHFEDEAHEHWDRLCDAAEAAGGGKCVIVQRLGKPEKVVGLLRELRS